MGRLSLKIRIYILCIITIAFTSGSINLLNYSDLYENNSNVAIAEAKVNYSDQTKTPNFKKNDILVTGDDTKSIVFLILGDGFTESEQDLFDHKASIIKDYIMETAPFSNYKDVMNFYSLNVISKESGAANNPNERKDTYFQSSYNYAYNIERLLAPLNSKEAYTLAEYYVPHYDRIIMVVNDERYGGSGGFIPVTSINSNSYEILIHEMGHSIGNLADEYWAGSYYASESPNMTRESDPDKVPWSDLIGVNGVGVYPYEEDNTWFRPHQSCKMRYLGQQYPFCDVCQRALSLSLENLIWQSNKVNTYKELLTQIKVRPANKALYLGGTTGNTIQIKENLPTVLRKVEKFNKSLVKTDYLEVVFNYRSSNKKVATVSKNGKVTAKETGKASIYVTANLIDGTKKEFEIPITVSKASIKITDSVKTMKVGQSYNFKAKVNGYKASDIIWSSTSNKITINKKTGKAVAKSSGITRIIAKVGKIQHSMEVTIVSK